jgi:hypothetical protein
MRAGGTMRPGRGRGPGPRRRAWKNATGIRASAALALGLRLGFGSSNRGLCRRAPASTRVRCRVSRIHWHGLLFPIRIQARVPLLARLLWRCFVPDARGDLRGAWSAPMLPLPLTLLLLLRRRLRPLLLLAASAGLPWLLLWLLSWLLHEGCYCCDYCCATLHTQKST